MRTRPARGAGEIGAKHYAALFGDRTPDKKKDVTRKNIEARRNSQQTNSIVAEHVEFGKAFKPCTPG